MSSEDNDPSSTSSIRSSRFTHWTYLFIFSVITLGSSVETAGDFSDRSSAQNWAICISALSFLISAAAEVFHFWSVMSSLFIGTKLEGAFSVFLMVGWAAGVATVTDSDNSLAVDSEGQVANGNLYYFSWASFVCSVTIVSNYLQSVYNVNIASEIHNKSKRMTLWSAMLAVCIVVMASSSNVYENVCRDSPRTESNKYCERTAIGISFGTIGTLMALAIVAVKISDNIVPFFFEGVAALLLVIFYAFGVAYITSNDGPGAPLGNLYYSSWAAFLLALMLAKSCIEDYQSAKAITEQQQAQEQNGENSNSYENNIQVETLQGDENI